VECGCQGLGAGLENPILMGTRFQLQDEKSYGHGWWCECSQCHQMTHLKQANNEWYVCFTAITKNWRKKIVSYYSFKRIVMKYFNLTGKKTHKIQQITQNPILISNILNNCHI
jgi:hypothetical protein